VSNTDDVLKEINKEMGGNIVSKASEAPTIDRIPTGVFPFDLAIGGGFPRGRASIVYGPEGSLKTTLALLAIAYMQKMEPHKKCVFVDIEASYDPAWGDKLGVDNDAMVYVQPDYAEQAIDIIDAFLYADDVGIIAVDSLAALIPANEAESSAEKASVGGAGLLISKFYRKATLAMAKAKKAGNAPTLIAINQIRMKIGVMHGNPETMPGGQAFKFFSSMTVRLYGKNEVVKSIHPTLPTYKLCSGVVKKWKVPITNTNFEFKLGLVTSPANGIQLGKCDDWNTLSTWMKKMGVLHKIEKGQGWICLEQEYKTLIELKEHVISDPELNDKLRALVFDTVIANGGLLDG